MKIVTVVGARPQFIKAAAVSREIAKHPEIHEVIVHTGQHFDRNMSDIFFEEMQIPKPDYNLEINSMSHGAMTGRMLEKIEGVLKEENPDYVMVYGDTNSTLAGALAAKKLHLRVAHVEAGLRSFNLNMPEEINRILTDRISDILFCPTDNAVANLIKEGFEHFPCRIEKVGDVMYDAALFYSELAAKKSKIIEQLGLEQEEFVLCTVHRAENTDNLKRLCEIINALNDIALEMNIVLPLHPRTARIINDYNIRMAFSPIGPVSYFDMIELLKKTKLVMTDSGGLQKEAYFFGKRCVILRDETEWVELVQEGSNALSGGCKVDIIECYAKMKECTSIASAGFYGQGRAAGRILSRIIDAR